MRQSQGYSLREVLFLQRAWRVTQFAESLLTHLFGESSVQSDDCELLKIFTIYPVSRIFPEFLL